ncbi:MAG TPA: transcription antitermination factor NusB [Candidatus Tectomicrobia bacterium]|jgi:transcription antitermination factor NusB
MGKRRQSREAALKLLYALDITHAEVEAVLAATWVETVVPQEVRNFTTALVTGVMAHREDIDTLIQEWSAHWSLERIGIVERNILRFAIHELLFMPDIPPKVTINEAVEVAKKYGAGEASLFINGILDRIAHEVTPYAEDLLPTASGATHTPVRWISE